LCLIDNVSDGVLRELSDNSNRVLESLNRDLEQLAQDTLAQLAQTDSKDTFLKIFTAPLASQKRLARIIKVLASILLKSKRAEPVAEIVVWQPDKLVETTSSSWKTLLESLQRPNWDTMATRLDQCLSGDSERIGTGLLPALETFCLRGRILAPLYLHFGDAGA